MTCKLIVLRKLNRQAKIFLRIDVLWIANLSEKTSRGNNVSVEETMFKYFYTFDFGMFFSEKKFINHFLGLALRG